MGDGVTEDEHGGAAARGVMGRVQRGELRLRKAAELMGISYRQAKRIWCRYRERGDAGLTHGLRGQVSGRARPAVFKKKALARYVEVYRDFGPRLAAEHFATEGMVVAAETLRRWLVCEGLWQRKRKRRQHRQWRQRREQVRLASSRGDVGGHGTCAAAVEFQTLSAGVRGPNKSMCVPNDVDAATDTPTSDQFAVGMRAPGWRFPAFAEDDALSAQRGRNGE